MDSIFGKRQQAQSIFLVRCLRVQIVFGRSSLRVTGIEELRRLFFDALVGLSQPTIPPSSRA